MRLYPVSVRIDDEGGVVIGAVHRPQTGRAVITPSSAQRCGVERVDGGCIWRCKAEMQTRLFVWWDRVLGGKNPKRDAVGPVAVADKRPRSPYAFVTKRCQDGVVEGPASVD